MSDRKRDGRRIAGRYELLEPIGRGGMGIVWRAHDELLDRTVAVKEVRYAAALGEEVQLLNRRTMREARAAARFEHPNVIVVHDVIEEDGRPWIVMQLVQSRSLGAVIKQDGPLPAKRVAEIGLAVLDALHRAHESGVLHRDVKPENVLLADDGRVVLTDFGIATLETETQLTVTGLAGTPAFIAPERLKGLPARRESDLWSLGATLYTALEGRSPHERGMALATMHAVLTDEPDPAPHAGPLGPVVDGLLVKEPVQRLSYEETGRLLREVIAQQRPRFSRAAQTAVIPPAEDETPTDPDLVSEAPLPETGHRLPAAPVPEPEPDLAGPTVTSRRSDGRRAGPVVAAVIAVVVVAGVGGYLGLRSAPGDSEPGSKTAAVSSPSTKTSTGASAQPSATTSPPESAQPSATPTTEPPSPSPSATPKATKEPAAIPSGWYKYTNSKMKFSVALPKGWHKYTQQGDQIFFRKDGTSTPFVSFDMTKSPGSDALKDWKKQEKTAKYGFGGYKLIGIKSVKYMKDAADWEFYWNANSGKSRVRNRGFVADNGRGYSIYWHCLASHWKKDLHYFDTFASTFTPLK